MLIVVVHSYVVVFGIVFLLVVVYGMHETLVEIGTVSRVVLEATQVVDASF